MSGKLCMYTDKITSTMESLITNEKVQQNMDKRIQYNIINYITDHRVIAIITESNLQDMMEFLHKALFSPFISNLLEAVKNVYISTIKGTTVNNIRKYLPNSEET